MVIVLTAFAFRSWSPGGNDEPLATRQEYGGTPLFALRIELTNPPTSTSLSLVAFSEMSRSGGIASRIGTVNCRVIGLTPSTAEAQLQGFELRAAKQLVRRAPA